MNEPCPHYWMPSKVNADGDPEFRMNRQMSAEPLTHAQCKLCRARTWFTREQWFAIPATQEPELAGGNDGE